MDKNISYWMTSGPWYNTYICEKVHENVFEKFIRNARTDRYNIMCYIDSHETIMHQTMMIKSVVVVIRYHQIQQQNHSFLSMQTYISFVVGYKP